MIKISVIIPTYNRLDTLKACLRSFQEQRLDREAFELIVVNDGGRDGTDEFMGEFCGAHGNTRYLRQENRGPAAARNNAVGQARGKYVLFTGDDIIPTPDLLSQHLKFLDRDKAVLGFTDWDKDAGVSDFMGYLEWRGHQFAYRGLPQGGQVPWDRFYTSNISLERKWFDGELFDENFRYPAWEDLELGYRLWRKGLRIVFNREARAFHRHSVTEKEFYNKAWQAGYSHGHFMSKHSLLKEMMVNRALRALVFSVSKGLKTSPILDMPMLKSLRWEVNIQYYKTKGLEEFLSGNLPARHTSTGPRG